MIEWGGKPPRSFFFRLFLLQGAVFPKLSKGGG
nr:MAG TPA: hypothetical protein [Bacteriophage sp.]